MFYNYNIHSQLMCVLKALCLLTVISTKISVIADPEADSCAVLYENSNYGGLNFSVGDGNYFSNLEEEYTSSSSVWNSTLSFKVRRGCLFTACNESYFDGHCQEFRKKAPALPPVFQHMDSVNCTCAADCRCSAIYMRKSTCARAYLDGECNICNSYYTDLKGSKPYFPDEFMKRTKSVLIRPGCTLTTYDEEDFKGDYNTFERRIESWDPQNKFQSYDCTCSESDQLHVPAQNKTRSPKYPAFVNVPQTLDEISQMINGEIGRHPALEASLKSIKVKRSSRNAYILLLGTTGSGKSSAINFLFDKPNLTKVGHGNSTTDKIHEFRVPVPVDELGIGNSELRVIDTPGLGDTKGIEHDAKFLATLHELLNNHEELQNRIPNVVLIFHKFHDNRFVGEGTTFVKMLRGLDSFRTRITDKNYSNVIFVLTHFTAETKDVARRPKSKLALFKQVIEEYSRFPKPISIVVAENKPEAQELPLLNGYYRLPNRDYYPRNLFEKIQVLTSSGGDPIGESIITAAFRDSDNFNVSTTTTSLVGSENAKVSKYLSVINGAIYGIKNTEVSQLLGNASEYLSPDLKKKFPDSLHYLQKALNIRNILTTGDLPRTTLEIIKLLTGLKMNEAILYLLEEGLSIKPPILKENPITGFSYNVFKDMPLPISPLKLGTMKNSDIGYTFPAVMSCIVERNGVEIFNVFKNKEDYVKYRLQSLNIAGKIPASKFIGEIRPGSNIEGVKLGSEGSTFTALREFRNFDLVLNDELELTQHFVNTLKTLSPFNSSDHENVENWTNFFNEYGTHVVQSAHGGGAIEIQLHSKQPIGLGVVELLYDFVQFAEDAALSRISNKTLAKEGIQHSLKFHGGDHAYHTTDLTKMSLDESAQLLENWKKSLSLSPTILTSETKLLPLSELAKKVSQNISSEIQRATELLFSSSLKYERIKKPATDRPGSGREETTFPQNDNTAMFTEMLTTLMEDSRKADERFQTIIIKMEEDRKQDAKRRETARQDQMAWEREQEIKREEERRQDIRFARQAELERQKWQHEMQMAREKAERDRQLREEEYRKEIAVAAAVAAAQQAALIRALGNGRGGGGVGGVGGWFGSTLGKIFG